ncbi:MAG: hypothetical protein WDN26_22545 [Chitinophagaceae bacterium]
MKKGKAIVPKQLKGGKSVSAYSVQAKDMLTAKKIFENAKLNLLNVNKWHSLAGRLSADFQLVNKEGEKIFTDPEKGNYFRINIPPAPGYDWVRVEATEAEQQQDYDRAAIRVRPAIPPFEKNGEVIHFFTPDATSSFLVERKGKKITASVIGRNEIPNTATKNLLHKIRNAIVAIAAIAGFNKPQWKSLVKGIIKNKS